MTPGEQEMSDLAAMDHFHRIQAQGDSVLIFLGLVVAFIILTIIWDCSHD